MEDSGAISTVEHGGMTITSVGVSEADVKAGLAASDEARGEEGPDKPEKPKSAKERAAEAARELGQRGGKAAAKARAEAGKASPAPEKGATTQSAPGSDGAEADEEADDAPLSKRAQRRVEQATRQAAEHRRQLETAQRQHAEERARLEARLAALEVAREGKGAEGRQTGEQPTPQRDRDARPRMADYDDYEKYEDDLLEWKERDWTRKQQREQYAQGEVQRYQHYTDRFVEALKPVIGDMSDDLLQMRPYYLMEDHHGPVRADNLIAAELAFLAEKGPAVMRHLTDHPDELQRIRAIGLDHPAIRVEIQVLARTIGSQADATTGEPPAQGERASKPAQSRAHPPLVPVKGSAPVATSEGLRDGEDFDSYVKRRGRY